MSRYEDALRERTGGNAIPAPRVVELLPSDFASDWPNRPVQPVPIGLRLPSEDDVQIAHSAADKRLSELKLSDGEEAVRAWNDALIAAGVARSICSPHDIREPHPVLEFAEDQITAALTKAAIRRLFDELERLMIESSPLAIEATDEDLRMLADRIVNGEHQKLGTVAGKAFRRFARYCLEMLPDAT